MAHWLDKVLELLSAETADLKELASIAGADHRTFYIGIDPQSLDLDGQDIEGIVFSEEATFEGEQRQRFLRQIYAAKRQEERVVLLLKELLDGLSSRDEIAKAFPATTRFEKRGIQEMRRQAGLFDATSRSGKIIAITTMANRFYQLSFTERKGLLLYFFAKHLGYVPQIREFVERKLSKSVSGHVLSFESEIQQALADHAP